MSHQKLPQRVGESLETDTTVLLTSHEGRNRSLTPSVLAIWWNVSTLDTGGRYHLQMNRSVSKGLFSSNN